MAYIMDILHILTEGEKGDMMKGRRCNQWQNVKFAAKRLLLVLRFPTHTDVLTEHGSQMLKR